MTLREALIAAGLIVAIAVAFPANGPADPWLYAQAGACGLGVGAYVALRQYLTLREARRILKPPAEAG